MIMVVENSRIIYNSTRKTFFMFEELIPFRILSVFETTVNCFLWGVHITASYGGVHITASYRGDTHECEKILKEGCLQENIPLI